MREMIALLKSKLKFLKKIGFLHTFYRFLKRVCSYRYRRMEQSVLERLHELETVDEASVRRINREKLLEMLSYAYRNSDYYKGLFDRCEVDISSEASLEKIPFLTKAIIRQHTDALICRGFAKKNLVKRNTGGSTTGQPLEFYYDKMTESIDSAHHWYLYALMGYEKGDRIIDVRGTHIPPELRERKIFWTRRDPECVWGEYNFSALYLTDETLPYYVEKLLELKPAILRGYPSFFDRVARYMLARGIVPDFRVKGINLTSEICSLSQRKSIEAAFSSMVYFEYGHTEASVYCYTQDASYVYRSSPIYGYVEVLKENGEPAEIGETGQIVVTGFLNHGMPFIRYQTGDLGEVAYRNGGVVHLKEIVGRSQDYIVTKKGRKMFLSELVFGQYLKAFEHVSRWQLAQKEQGRVTIRIVREKGYRQEDEEEILQLFQRRTDVEITFDYVDAIPQTKMGKHLFMLQSLAT